MKKKGPKQVGSKLEMPKHSRGFQKNIILDDPNAQIDVVSEALVFKDKMDFTVSTHWDGSDTQVIMHAPGAEQGIAAVEFVRHMLSKERIALRKSIDDGKPAHTNSAITEQHIKFLEKVDRDCLNPLSKYHTAQMLNERKDAPKPMMAVVSKNDPKK